MPDAKRSVIHIVAAIVLILAAAVLLVQVVLMAGQSDEEILTAVKAGARMERERHNYGPFERPPTDEEMDQRIAENRAELLKKAKDETRTPMIMKGVFSVLMVVVAAGLFMNKRNPTRTAAIITTILLLIGVVGAFKNMSESLEIYKYIESASKPFMYFVDVGMIVMLPLALVFSIIVAAKPPSGE
jgi:cation transport ATPase